MITCEPSMLCILAFHSPSKIFDVLHLNGGGGITQYQEIHLINKRCSTPAIWWWVSKECRTWQWMSAEEGMHSLVTVINKVMEGTTVILEHVHSQVSVSISLLQSQQKLDLTRSLQLTQRNINNLLSLARSWRLCINCWWSRGSSLTEPH